ncbi:MAG: hypothetical protein Q8823_02125 [Candidatus Phytoplasma australasiaticum]|nr:hypothetical protein [Candidatus Phytoplasma australasiaticum]
MGVLKKQNFFLKQLSEDLENFVQLQPVINVHFRILDWNLLKDDYISIFYFLGKANMVADALTRKVVTMGSWDYITLS